MVAFALGAHPFDAAYLVAVLGHLLSPDRYGPCHHMSAGGKSEFLDPAAGPLIALVAGVVSIEAPVFLDTDLG